MDKMENRSPIKNLGYTFVHWILVVLISFISFCVQYSFLIDTGESYSSFIFSGNIYHVNYVTFPIGVAIFLFGFCFVWKKLLVEDWKLCCEQSWKWKAAYVLIASVVLFAIIAIGALVVFLYLGLSGDITPTWTVCTCFAYPIYAVLVIVVDCLKNRKRTDSALW